MVFVHFFKLSAKKTHANPTIINEKIKEIHILTVGGVPGISNFKSHASPPCLLTNDQLIPKEMLLRHFLIEFEIILPYC